MNQRRSSQYLIVRRPIGAPFKAPSTTVVPVSFQGATAALGTTTNRGRAGCFRLTAAVTRTTEGTARFCRNLSAPARFDRVYAYVSRRVRGRSEAEDLTSEVFHKALANIERFEWRGAPFAACRTRTSARACARS